MKWWIQSFIVGIPTILCGYRDDNGMVTDLETFDVKDLRKNGEVRFLKINIELQEEFFIFFVSIGLLAPSRVYELLPTVPRICQAIYST